METKFTKGEWKALKTGLNETCIFSDVDMEHIFKITHNEGSKMQSDANAKLIAAAPDLLEALKLMVARAELRDNNNGIAFRTAQQAIKKATE